MNNDFLQQWAEMNKNFMESMKHLSEITNGMMGKLTERQMAMVSAYMEGVSKQFQAMGEAKGVQDIAAAQAKLAKEFNEKLLENTQQSMDILAKTRTDLTSWMEKGMEAAAKLAGESAKSATKSK